MIDKQFADYGTVTTTDSALFRWWVVTSREFIDLWLRGRALILLILFSVLLGVITYNFATSEDLILTTPEERVFQTLRDTIAVGLFIGVILAADSISGERERETFEGLLLAPISRRQIIIGKFLAAFSSWPIALIIASAYLALLSPDTETLVKALIWGAILGSIMVAAFTGVGMLLSIRSNSSRISLSISLVLFILIYIPTQFPGSVKKGPVGTFFRRINPIEATNHFLETIIVNNRAVDEMVSWLLAPILFSVVVLGYLFLLVGPSLRIYGGKKV